MIFTYIIHFNCNSTLWGGGVFMHLLGFFLHKNIVFLHDGLIAIKKDYIIKPTNVCGMFVGGCYR